MAIKKTKIKTKATKSVRYYFKVFLFWLRIFKVFIAHGKIKNKNPIKRNLVMKKKPQKKISLYVKKSNQQVYESYFLKAFQIVNDVF